MSYRSLLFVCLGNICRSPLGEAIFVHKARAEGILDGLVVDSAGIGSWHVGDPADPRTIEVASHHGVVVTSVARQVERADLERFDLLLPMDRQNQRDLLAMGAPPARVRLMRSFDPALAGTDAHDVPDPYLGGPEGFQTVYRMLDAACEGLVRSMRGA